MLKYEIDHISKTRHLSKKTQKSISERCASLLFFSQIVEKFGFLNNYRGRVKIKKVLPHSMLLLYVAQVCDVATLKTKILTELYSQILIISLNISGLET